MYGAKPLLFAMIWKSEVAHLGLIPEKVVS
jgi:hypothetical protein